MLFDRWRQRVLSQWHTGSTWRIRLNLCILRPSRLHNRNGKWIGLTVFAQLTAESAYTLQWAPLSTRIAPSHGDLDLPCNTHAFGPCRRLAVCIPSYSGRSLSLEFFCTTYSFAVIRLWSYPPPIIEDVETCSARVRSSLTYIVS